MSSRTVRFAMLGLAVFALSASGILAPRSGAASRVTAAEVNDAKIKSLRNERLTTLKAAAEINLLFFRTSRIPFGEVIEANRAVRHAELELCDSTAERVTVLEKMLTEAQELEQFTKAQKEAARDSEVAVLKAKAYRLEIEIALEQAKAK